MYDGDRDKTGTSENRYSRPISTIGAPSPRASSPRAPSPRRDPSLRKHKINEVKDNSGRNENWKKKEWRWLVAPSEDSEEEELLYEEEIEEYPDEEKSQDNSNAKEICTIDDEKETKRFSFLGPSICGIITNVSKLK